MKASDIVFVVPVALLVGGYMGAYIHKAIVDEEQESTAFHTWVKDEQACFESNGLAVDDHYAGERRLMCIRKDAFVFWRNEGSEKVEPGKITKY